MRPDIEAIKARCEAATDGPWYTNKYGGIGAGEFALNPIVIKGDENPFGGFWPFQGCRDLSPKEQRANFDFVKNARTDLPACLAYIAELEADLKAVGVEAQ